MSVSTASAESVDSADEITRAKTMGTPGADAPAARLQPKLSLMMGQIVATGTAAAHEQK